MEGKNTPSGSRGAWLAGEIAFIIFTVISAILCISGIASGTPVAIVAFGLLTACMAFLAYAFREATKRIDAAAVQDIPESDSWIVVPSKLTVHRLGCTELASVRPEDKQRTTEPLEKLLKAGCKVCPQCAQRQVQTAPTWILNTNTMTAHRPGCPAAAQGADMTKKRATAGQLKAAGYTLCKRCCK